MHGRPAPQETGEPRESHPQRWRILAVLVLALNLVVDLLYAVLDPRIRHGHA